MLTRLSPHFTLEEMIASQTAFRKGIDNTPPAAVIEALRHSALQMERVRELLGAPIAVSSGYRSPILNRSIGGAATSAHLRGWAVDFTAYGFGSPLEVCRAIATSPIEFDQLIEEGRWIHISFDPRLRRQVLTLGPAGGYVAGLRHGS